MAENRQEQIEALAALNSYSTRLINCMNGISDELRGNRQPDTDEYLKKIIDGINWSIQVLNGTLSLINESEERIKKEEVNNRIIALSDAYQAKDDVAIAVAILELIPIFENLRDISGEYAA